MTDKYPNIKRPIKTAPTDGTEILIWYGHTNPEIVHWEGGAFRDRNNWPKFGQVYWSPMPQEPEPEHCCEMMGHKIDQRHIGRSARGSWIFRGEETSCAINFCPFCGEKLND